LPSASVSIIGSGVVGTATGKGLARLGHDVIFYDTNMDKLRKLASEGFQTTRNISEAITSSSISFICVQTPASNNGNRNLRYVKKAVTSAAEALQRKADYHLIVVRSTLLPGTCRGMIIPILQGYRRSKLFEHFGLCYNPEFLRRDSALEDFVNPSRIVIGEANKKSGDILQRLYSPISRSVMRTDFDTAEMIKLVSNAFLATKISFFNQIHALCQKLGIDDRFVSEAVSLDPRIGKYGIYGGRPFSGGCLPNDVKTFAKFMKAHNIKNNILKTALAINESMKTEET